MACGYSEQSPSEQEAVVSVSVHSPWLRVTLSVVSHVKVGHSHCVTMVWFHRPPAMRASCALVSRRTVSR
jgi:hypothetical protein